MEDEKLDDRSEDRGFTSSSALSAARGNDACRLVEGIATRRRSFRSSPRKKTKQENQMKQENQNSYDCSLKKDCQIGVHDNEGDAQYSSSVASVPRQKMNTFEEWLIELAAFKAKHGNCNVPATASSEYYSLDQWCRKMRSSYKKIQEGKIPPKPLSQDQIGRLEALDFRWSKKSYVFEKWLAELTAFKAKHGNYNVHATPSSEYYSLGQWCSKKRSSYKKIQEGKTPQRPLSQDQIGQLEALGFEWSRQTSIFEERLIELSAFKAKHRNCNVHKHHSGESKALGKWCRYMRSSYKKIQEGKTPQSPLSQDQIGRLEALGFEWSRM